jgi:hypothetical protein
MSLSNCPTVEPRDSLSRDHSLHISDGGTSPAVKIALGVLLGLLLSIAGILSGPPQSVDRFAPPESEQPSRIATDRDGPWTGIGR